jgi:hypothetical protein
MIGSDSFGTSQAALSITMKMCCYSAHASGQCCCTIVFSTATVGAIGSDAGGLVYASATVLVLVAMLPAFASAAEPFKSKLIFGDLHDVNWQSVLEDTVLTSDRTALVAFYVLLLLNRHQCEPDVLQCLVQVLSQ